jgi:hypothetical protein
MKNTANWCFLKHEANKFILNGRNARRCYFTGKFRKSWTPVTSGPCWALAIDREMKPGANVRGLVLARDTIYLVCDNTIKVGK